MFIRELKSSKGKVYIQVVDKSSGKYRVLKSFGGAADDTQRDSLRNKAQQWIVKQTRCAEFDFSKSDVIVEQLFESITAIKRIGYDLLLGKIFDDIGFGKIRDAVFKELVLARVAFPKSKLKTTEYLLRYKQIDWDEDHIYRYLDKLHSSQKEDVQRISFVHTRKVLDDDISVVFYDVTTLYFEIDQEDEFRKTGFSKEGKHQQPQIVLGLLVSKKGYPLAYEMFEGSTFEGHTMLPVMESFRRKYNLNQLVIIADSGLLSKANIDKLQSGNHEFIIGARIKNESARVKEKILSLSLGNGQSEVINKDDLRLIITYSDDRAKKDRYNREKGIRKLEKHIQRGRLTKASINNRGYNKFLKLDGQIKVTLDEGKIKQDSRWDGLKGYLTNARLSKDHQVIKNYQHLWQIEAHICISFVAYKVYKERRGAKYILSLFRFGC